jgi:hypothetical protein
MSNQVIFYYPYANFTNDSSPILCAAALYFDKLYVLDPLKASQGRPGAFVFGEDSKDATLLEQAGILERIQPAEVLEKYADQIKASFKEDLEDKEFIDLCNSMGRAATWELALEKVPENLKLDSSMSKAMGETPRSVVDEVSQYNETVASFHGKDLMYDEPRGKRVYRLGSYPLPVGESIMLNHALYAGLVMKEAVPVTDDDFHSRVFARKIERALKHPDFAKIMEKREKLRGLRSGQSAYHLLTGFEVEMPGFKPGTRLEQVLRFREKHASELQRARFELERTAYDMETVPLTGEFLDDLKFKRIVELQKDMDECKKAQASWLEAAGLAAGAVAAAIALVINPTPIVSAAALAGGLGLFSANIVPALKWLKAWRDGKKSPRESGLHYLMKFRG